MGQSSFIHLAQRTRQIPENAKHKLARLRVVALYESAGYAVTCFIPEHRETEKGFMPYEIDIVAEKNGRVVFIEIDGKVHAGSGQQRKDDFRDSVFQSEGIPTVRYLVKDVNGFTFKKTGRYYRLEDAEILARIEAHMK